MSEHQYAYTAFPQLFSVFSKLSDSPADHQRITAAKAKVDAVIPADATFSIFEHTDKSTWANGDNFVRGGQPVYQALGRKPPADNADEIIEKQ